MTKRIRVWDLPTRVFHWLLVLLCICSVVTARIDELQWHERSGLAILVLICWRIIWGFFGSDTAKFRNFVAGPPRVFSYFRNLKAGDRNATFGHNPAGGWVVVLFLLLLLSQAGTGLFSNDEIVFDGPLAQYVSRDLSDTLTSWHHRVIQGLFVIIALHVIANFGYWFALKQNLIKPMFTGKKQIANDITPPAMRFRSNALAMVVLTIIVAVVAVTIGFR